MSHPAAIAPTPRLHDFVPQVVGRYEIIGTLGRGGMATVYLGRTAGEAGFSRLFAIKVLHPHLADEAGFVTMLLDEASIAAGLHHPNVVPVLDVGSHGDLRYVTMEYIEGCSFQALLSKNRGLRPPRLVLPIVLDTLAGLHAAHSLVDETGKPMNLVHRDVSPHNVLLGVDGSARLTDFGVARAESRISSTRPGQIKGKIAFMSPEQIRTTEIDNRSDVFSVGSMLWSALTGRRLFLGANDADTMMKIMSLEVPPPSTIGLKPPKDFDAIILRALERDLDKRWSSAQEMEEALREAAIKAGALGSRREVSEWVQAAYGEELKMRRAAVRALTGTRAERSANADLSQSRSGLQKIPAVGPTREEDEYDLDPNLLTPSSRLSHLGQSTGNMSWPSAVMQSGSSQVSTEAMPVFRSSPTPRILAIAVGAAVVAAALVAGLLRSPAPAAPSVPPTPVTVAAPVVAAPPVVTAASPAAAPVAPTIASTVTPAAAAPPQAPARPVYQPGWRPPAAQAPKPQTAGNNPSSPAPPADNPAPAKPTTWDKDSPLPPP